MPQAKPRKLSDLSDEELAAENKRRKAANRPKRVRVYEMDEDTYARIHGKKDDDEEEDKSDSDDDEDDSDEGSSSGYFS